MRKDTYQWLIPALLALGVAGALWFYWGQSRQQDRKLVEPATPAVEAPEEVREGPEHPLETTRDTAAAEPQLRPLPPLDESDEYFKLELSDLFGESLDNRLADSGLIERIVATVDNLPREQIAERIKPMAGAPGPFIVKNGGKEDEFILDPENYQRYEALVDLVAKAEPAELEELYRRFYPLFQKAYVDLGYPQGYFNDRVIEVIDHLLETPEIDGPVLLRRPHVLYEYADPALEELSPGQKLLLRIGNEHAATIKAKLREFRGRIIIP
ncbi:MAG: DUF3014 domain-containing protein [Woeseia sp.]